MQETLTNIATLNGTYNGLPTSQDTDAFVTLLVDGLTISKTADKQVWSDDGALTYTIIVNNATDQSILTPTIVDTIDITLVDFVDASVTLNGTTYSNYVYDSATGKLTITLDDIATPSGNITITFQVEKKA